jgi:hypothetical protein
MPSQTQGPFRFSRDVDQIAPKPGHHLGTASFQLGDETHLLWIIEGPENDALCFKGMATDFNGSRVYKFKLRGSMLEAAGDLPYSPYDRQLKFQFRMSGAPINLKEGTVIFTGVRAPNGLDPDGALMLFTTTKKGDTIRVALTDLRRGWHPVVVIVGIGLALACGGCATPPPGAEVTVTESAGVSVTLSAGLPEYGLGVAATGSYSYSQTFTSTAPVGTSSTATPGSTPPAGP